MQCIQKSMKGIKTEPPTECDIGESTIMSHRIEKHSKMYNSGSCPAQKHQLQNSTLSSSNIQPTQKIILCPRMDYNSGYHQTTTSKHHYVTPNEHRPRSPTVISTSYHHHQPHQPPVPNTQPAPQIIITQSTGGTPVRVIRDGRFYEESQRMSNSVSPTSSPPPLAPTSSGHHGAIGPLIVGHPSASSEKFLEQHPQQASSSTSLPSNRKFIISRPVNVISRNKLDSYSGSTNNGNNNNSGRLSTSSVVNSSDGFRPPVVSSSGNNMCSNTPMRPPPPPPPKIKTIPNMTNCGGGSSVTSNEEPSSSIPDLGECLFEI